MPGNQEIGKSRVGGEAPQDEGRGWGAKAEPL